MHSTSRALLYGFLVWLVPFVISFFIFPLKASHLEFFKATIAVTVAVTGVIFAVLYFKSTQGNALREGIIVGVLWLFISIAIDLCLFLWGPMKMPFSSYLFNIEITYLIYPAITIGMSVLR
ncbi:MAG: hypothetical protein WCG83_02190 [Candidatus Peregrinibacteria bacterium]